MTKLQHHAPLSLALVFLLLGAADASSEVAEPADLKPTVPASEFGRWERLRSPVLSPTGEAFAYLVMRVDGERELVVRRLEPEETWRVPWGRAPVFSDQGEFLAFEITPTKEEQKKLKEKKIPVVHRGELLVLATGERRELGEVAKLEFDSSGRFLAVQGPPDGEGETAVCDLHVRDLTRETVAVFGNVESFAWHEERPLLAMIIRGRGERGNAVQVFSPETGHLQGLDHANSVYRHLAWSEEAAHLAVLRAKPSPSPKAQTAEKENAPGEDPEKEEPETEGVDTTEYELLAWADLAAGEPSARPEVLRLDAADTADAADAADAAGSYITGDTEPAWSEDGARLSIGIRPRLPETSREGDSDSGGPEEDSDEPDEDEALPGVQIWHSSDVRIIPEQKWNEQEDLKRTLLAVWDRASGRLVRVGTDLRHKARVLASWEHALEEDESPYAWGQMFGRPYLDVWTVDLATGERRKSLEKVRHWWPSAEGRYLLWFDGAHYWSLELASGARENLTGDVPARFADTDRDLPHDGLVPPHGVGGWVSGDRAVLLYTEFDIWRVTPDGRSAVRLTKGEEDQVVHRLLDLDDEEEAHPEEEGLYFAARGEWTEKRGFARFSFDEGYRRLVLEDKSFWNLQKAKAADALLYRRESRTDSPELFLTDPSFRAPRLVADSNPFLADYAWTRAELLEYRNAEDRKLQGVLLYPANHDPRRKYPMIVYAYEILSPTIHVWEWPDEKDYYNVTTWTQRGYFVLLPDIRFRGGDPGVSVAETLSAAIDTVDRTGLIDRERVGFAGHSWGGYEATYLAARTNLFAATVAGAPLTDFVSFMGQIHWRPGFPEPSHWETGQGRMVVPYWEDPEGHHRNSPLHGVHEMTTPILMAHGDQDGVVEFFQSTVFYNFARRAGKQMVLLVYEGEDHGFRREENQIDYHRRILEWFDHYLKGEDAPGWIRDGMLWQDHEEEKRRVAGSGENDPIPSAEAPANGDPADSDPADGGPADTDPADTDPADGVPPSVDP